MIYAVKCKNKKQAYEFALRNNLKVLEIKKGGR